MNGSGVGEGETGGRRGREGKGREGKGREGDDVSAVSWVG